MHILEAKEGQNRSEASACRPPNTPARTVRQTVCGTGCGLSHRKLKLIAEVHQVDANVVLDLLESAAHSDCIPF